MSNDTQHPLPRIHHLGMVAPDRIALQIRTHRIEPVRREPYVAQPNDRIEVRQRGAHADRIDRRVLIRAGQEIGFVIPGTEPTLVHYEQRLGVDLDTTCADDPTTWTCSSSDDERFASARNILSVHRKSRVDGWAHPSLAPVMLHHCYLQTPEPLRVGCTYVLHCPDLALERRRVIFTYVPEHLRSEAVHCTQVGFRPDDSGACAYLSCWMGNGGGLSFPEPPRFRLVDMDNSVTVFSGCSRWCWPADRPEAYIRDCNYNHCDVWRLDFDPDQPPGRYRIVVDGIGCSYDFCIDTTSWDTAFRVGMRGLFHQRSGIPMGPPYADFVRPRSFHPGDGIRIEHCRYAYVDAKEGLGAKQYGDGHFDMVRGGRDPQHLLEQAWGGTMDAGDWDRRIKNLDATRLLIELFECHPTWATHLRLPIPEQASAVPDLLEEACFQIDVYRRMQEANGGVRGGIESAEHPIIGHCSWEEELPVVAHAPDPWSAQVYAGIAIRLATCLETFDPQRAETYRRSALAAMDWAEQDYEAWLDERAPDDAPAASSGSGWGGDGSADSLRAQLCDERHLAAVECWRATGDARWHELMRRTAWTADLRRYSVRRQDAAFAYLLAPPHRQEADLRAEAEILLLAAAERCLEHASGNAWGRMPNPDSDPNPAKWQTPYHGYYTIPAPVPVVRAYHLSREQRYLRAAVRSAGFVSGGNPLNLSFTTGLGVACIHSPLHADTRYSGQAAPSGITTHGPCDIPYRKHEQSGWFTWVPKFLEQHGHSTPSVYDWPVPETYFDNFNWGACTEYTVHKILGPCAYAWGHLAARV